MNSAVFDCDVLLVFTFNSPNSDYLCFLGLDASFLLTCLLQYAPESHDHLLYFNKVCSSPDYSLGGKLYVDS